MNLQTLMLGLAPAIAPSLGGLIVGSVGWRGIFVAMLVYGLTLALALSLRLPETNAQRDPTGISPPVLFRKYRRLLADARFLRPGLALGLVIATSYTLAAVLPFVMIGRVGLTAAQFGYATLWQSFALFLGNMTTRRLLGRYEARRLIPFGLGLSMLAATTLGAVVIGVGPSLFTVMGPLGIMSFATAMVLPGLWTEPVAPFGAIAGAASSLLGTIQMTLGVALTTIAPAFNDPVMALVFVAAPMPFYAALVYFGLAASAAKAALAAQGPAPI
jgi:DHA1 family bicyclomycin/chloramphenicol resistance-like MFS transporter